MGNLFSGPSSSAWANIDICFDDSKGFGQHGDLISRCDQALEKSIAIMKQLEDYEPKSEFIRQAITNPTKNHEDQAFAAVTANAAIIQGFWQFSQKLEELLPLLLSALSLEEDPQPMTLPGGQALALRFAKILDFVLKFDELKMTRPQLQNDFSFYRRQLNKHAQDPDLLVRDDEASYISLYVATHIPMMTAIAKATAVAFQKDDMVTESLANIANTFLYCIKLKKFGSDGLEKYILCCRAMAAAVILYDHVEPEGAFHKRTAIHVKQICQVIVKDFAKDFPQAPSQVGLASGMKFSTLHYKDGTCIDPVTKLLESV